MRIAVTLVLVMACKSSGGPTVDAAGGGSRTMTYDFNGTAHSGSLLATATLQTNNAGGNQLGLEAADAAGHILAIAVGPATPESTIAVGTYMTAVSEPLATFQYTDGSNGTGTWAAGGNANLTGSGEVTITVLTSTEIKGTFESTLTGSGNAPGSGTAMITNGVFDLPVN